VCLQLLLTGCETWPVNKNIAKRINAFKNNSYFMGLVDWTRKQWINCIRARCYLKLVDKQKVSYFDGLSDWVWKIMLKLQKLRRQWKKDVEEWSGPLESGETSHSTVHQCGHSQSSMGDFVMQHVIRRHTREDGERTDER